MALSPEGGCSSPLDVVSAGGSCVETEEQNAPCHFHQPPGPGPAPYFIQLISVHVFATALFPMTELLRHHLVLGPGALRKGLESFGDPALSVCKLTVISVLS